MATTSMIGIITSGGKIMATYCHSDGYPDGVGKTLGYYYDNSKKVQQLLTLGKSGISYLGPEIGEKHRLFSPPDEDWTGFYGRDKNERSNEIRTFKDIQDFAKNFDQDYGYVFDPKTKRWLGFNSNGKSIKIPGQKTEIKENKNINLKENYERFFGKMETLDRLGGKTKETVQEEGLSAEQQNFWTRVNSAFSSKYPRRKLENKNGYIQVDGHIVESSKTFFKRSLQEMTMKIRATVQRLGD